MVAFRRLSTCPTLPDLIRDHAEAGAARWMRTAPIEIWCLPSMLLLLQGHDGLPAALSGFTSLAPGEKAGERLQGRFRGMVLHAFCSGLSSLGGDPDAKQQLDHEPMARAHALRQFVARLSQENAAVGPGRHQAFPLKAGDALARGCMRD